MKSITVLLVEDSPGDVRLVQEALRDSSMNVTLVTASNGDQARRLLQGYLLTAPDVLPDIVLLDLNLPGMNGRELLTYIRSHAQFQAVPVVILTSSDAASDIDTTFAQDANCYISKPVDTEQLADVIQLITNLNRSCAG